MTSPGNFPEPDPDPRDARIRELEAEVASAKERTDREMAAHVETEKWRLSIASLRLAAESRLAEMEKAVRVLGARVHSCEHIMACYRGQRKPSGLALDTALDTQDAVSFNPIAAAAVKEKP